MNWTVRATRWNEVPIEGMNEPTRCSAPASDAQANVRFDTAPPAAVQWSQERFRPPARVTDATASNTSRHKLRFMRLPLAGSCSGRCMPQDEWGDPIEAAFDRGVQSNM